MSQLESQRFSSIRAGFAIAALATAAAVHAQPGVIYADAHAPAGGNGASWATAFRDLQDAIAAANADPDHYVGSQIRIAQGIYTPDRASGDRSMAFTPSSAISLMGGFAGLLASNPDQRDTSRFVTVLSGDLARNDGSDFTNYEDNSRCIVDLSDQDLAVLDGVTIRGGSAPESDDPFATRGVVTGVRKASNGQVIQRNVILHRCRLEQNLAGLGTPIVRGPIVLMFDCKVFGNSTIEAPTVFGATPFLIRCEFRGNRVRSVFVPEFSPGLIGGMVADAFPMHVLTCLFADNLCEGPGAIVCNGFSTSEISHCTFVAHPTLPRPAIAVLLGSRISLRNCVFAPGGGAPYPSAFVHVAAAQIFQDDIDSSNLFSNGQSGISVTSSPSFPVSVRAGDPAFVLPRGTDNDPATWRDNNYHLLASSPAIDTAGSSNEYPSNDYRDLDGTSPFDAPTVVNHGTGLTPYLDLGCYEFTERLCPADFNASGSLTPADIYDFLNAWLAADPRADFNGYGLSAQDIFDFLGAWFAGC